MLWHIFDQSLRIKGRRHFSRHGVFLSAGDKKSSPTQHDIWVTVQAKQNRKAPQEMYVSPYVLNWREHLTLHKALLSH